MWNKIGEIPLKTGEIMEVCVVKAPDSFYERNIVSFLSHYNELWLWHLDLAIHGKLDELEARFYLGILQGRIISNVSSWEHGRIGIVGHLFTLKNHRRKGACTALMKAQIQDFHDRGGRVLIGGFKPSSYPIAKSLGFKSIINKSEVMHHNLHPDFERDYFQAEKVFCRDTMWKDWPGTSLLFGIKEGWHIRSVKHKIIRPFDYEDYFLEDMKEKSKELCSSKVLTSERGSIVGYATLTLKHRFKGSFWLLDFFIHPSSACFADTILDAIDIPKGKTRCYIESECCEKRDTLLKRGFKERKIQGRTKHIGETLDVIAMEF